MQNDRKFNRAFPFSHINPNTPSSFNQDFLKNLELKDTWTGDMHFIYCVSPSSHTVPDTLQAPRKYLLDELTNGCIYGQMNEMWTWNEKEPVVIYNRQYNLSAGSPSTSGLRAI